MRFHSTHIKVLLIPLLMSFCSVFLEACGQLPEEELNAEAPTILAPNPYPTFRGKDFQGEKNFAFLINNYTKAKLNPTPWAGFWWPYTKNGIAANGDGGSPAGKYDAARGHTTHAQEWEIRKHGAAVPKVQQWWGHCNGWTVAAALFPEPHEAVTVNGINFGIGDIKALLSEAGMGATADFFGERLDWPDPDSPKYWDTIPDQYFLVLTNYIGKQNKPVLIDRYTGDQVWNQPLAAYAFEYPKPEDYLGNSAEAPNVYRILVTSTIWWLDDGVVPDIQTPPFSFENEDNGVIQSRTLRMEVWLDAPVVFDENKKIKSSGNVIVTRQRDYLAGGAWRIGDGYIVDGWPDYMWVPYGISKPTDPEEDYVNPEVDIDWIKKHLLVPGGADDHSTQPGSVEPAPAPVSSPSSTPSPGANTGSANPTSYPNVPPRSDPPPAPPSSIPNWFPTSVPNFPWSSPTHSPTSNFPEGRSPTTPTTSNTPNDSSNPIFPNFPNFPFPSPSDMNFPFPVSSRGSTSGNRS